MSWQSQQNAGWPAGDNLYAHPPDAPTPLPELAKRIRSTGRAYTASLRCDQLGVAVAAAWSQLLTATDVAEEAGDRSGMLDLLDASSVLAAAASYAAVGDDAATGRVIARALRAAGISTTPPTHPAPKPEPDRAAILAHAAKLPPAKRARYLASKGVAP